MSTTIEFGTKSGADAARDEHADHLADSDDRRLKTVEFDESLPDLARDQLEAGAETGRAERQEGTGQAELTQAEKKRLEPFTPPNNYLKAASVKALLRGNGVDDWTAWYDQSLSVDEHRSSVLPEATQAGGGSRFEDEGPDRDRAAAAEKAANSQCSHAQDHCEHGEPEACAFLKESCGYGTDEVDQILGADTRHEDSTEQTNLVTVGGGDYPEMKVRPEVAGALGRSWQGYKSAIGRLNGDLDDVRESVVNARQAMASINSIRERHDQEPLHPDRLHDLLDGLAGMPADIPQIRTLEHFRDVDEQDVIEQDDQRGLDGERVDDQARFSGNQRGEVNSQVETSVEENEGGLMADTREGSDEKPSASSTKTAIPDEFRVAEGGQRTL